MPSVSDGEYRLFIENGDHVYEIEYLVKNQIRYFEDRDELYWNVTGNYWLFPDRPEASAASPCRTGGGHDRTERLHQAAMATKATTIHTIRMARPICSEANRHSAFSKA
ncbi:MAG: DUF2207 domain-containing protein [Hyphomonas sp.]